MCKEISKKQYLKRFSILYLPLMKSSTETTKSKKFFFTSIKKGKFITSNKSMLKRKKLA